MRIIAPTASFRPLMRPCGIAMPWPKPVEPNFSRANRLSKTWLRATFWLFSNRRPACSNTRFLLLTSRSSTTFWAGSSWAIRFIVGGLSLFRAGRQNGRWHARGAASIFGLVAAGFASAAMLEIALLVLQYLAIELVDQRVDRRIHVRVVAFDKNVLAGEMHIGFDFLLELFHRENHVDVDDMIEMTRDARELAGHVIAHCGSDVHVMAAQMKIHD